MFKPALTLTFNNAKTVFEAGLQAIASGQAEIDLGALTAVDSSAVATLLAWQRAARGAGHSLTFHNIPAGLQNLASLYGVADLLHIHRHAAGVAQDGSRHRP
ncbi:STAS domain-containing protein [Noviherbaspirillum massiliense]|uniref:STAS domain-containing protein n=1 Tax=Noviherbaspirillum massiliense TaxID=1465823 RepID=UPI0002DA1978|nr:STAS domain-containing protein [Noviherbaspirillum massiliense]